MNDATPAPILLLVERGMAARREHRPEEALEAMKAAVAQARAGDDPVDLVHALHGLANVQRGFDEMESALALYQEAADLCRSLPAPLLLAHKIRHVGDVHMELGRPELARPCYEEALALYRADPSCDTLDFANAVRPMALLEQKFGDPGAAAELWEQARELYEAAGIQEGVDEASKWLEQLRR